MTSLHPRRPFTPQRSPSVPSSLASSERSSGGGQSRKAHDAEREQQQQPSQQQQQQQQQRRGTTCVNSSVLNCWTAHQSHGQVTILFYVPRWTKKEDLQIVFGSNYVIAGVQSNQQMVIQAQLAGRINTSTSTWRLERQSNKRSQSRSQSNKSGRIRVSAGSNSSSGEGRHQGEKKFAALTETPLKSTSAGSSASSDEASNSDPLSRSVDTLDSGEGWDHVRQSSASTPPEANTIMPLDSTSSSAPLDQSMTLSEESGYIASGSNSTGDAGVRSLESSIHSQSSSSQARSDDDAITDAKLLTLHLDKVDAGIWPFLVSGPASIDFLSSNTYDNHPAHQSLNAALAEVLRQEDEAAENLDSSFSQSTVTVDTMCSDDSTTVLGTTNATRDDESLYEMDPTSLVLMGIRHSKQGARSPFNSTGLQEEATAFEYFKRAWRRAEVPLATRRLVEDYLPLFPLHYNGATTMLRSRLTASLGGPTALARLYVSYARLHLPCFQDRQSPLAFPIGGLTNPFGGGNGQDHLSSPRSPGEQLNGYDALTYLREACSIDRNVVITDKEWNEAQAIASQSVSSEDLWRWGQKHEGEKRASESEIASQEKRSSSKVQKRDKKRKKKMSSSSKVHKEDSGRSSDKFSSDHGLIIVLVSRVALLSVVVAGGVAMAGWWRRAAPAS